MQIILIDPNKPFKVLLGRGWDYNTYKRARDATQQEFQKRMKAAADAYPAVIKIAKTGKGSRILISDVSINSQSKYNVKFRFYNYKITTVDYFKIEYGYSCLRSIIIDTDTKTLLINDNLAIKYE